MPSWKTILAMVAVALVVSYFVVRGKVPVVNPAASLPKVA
jgi:hypothetical protein